jgi:indole-3-glycerol phosphate synthase
LLCFRYNLTNSIKKAANKDDNALKMSVVVDMKRMSPTVVEKRNIIDFSDAGKFSELLTKVGADAFLINTDEMEYGGRLEDLKASANAVKEATAGSGRAPPACIQKDLIIHPVQVSHRPSLSTHRPPVLLRYLSAFNFMLPMK